MQISLLILVQVVAMVIGAMLVSLQQRSPAKAELMAAVMWWLAFAATVGCWGGFEYAGEGDHGPSTSIVVSADALADVGVLAALLMSGIGMLAGGDAARLLLAGGIAGTMAAEGPTWFRLIPLAGLVGLKLSDVSRSKWSWRCERLWVIGLAGGMTAGGMLLLDRGWGALAADWGTDRRELMGCCVLLVGTGGLLGWFPFPVIRYTVLAQDECGAQPAMGWGVSVADIVLRTALPCLAGGLWLIRALGQLQTEPPMAAAVVAMVLPAVFAGARLIRAEHLGERLALQGVVGLSSAIAPLPLLVWRSTRETQSPGLQLWETLNLPEIETLLWWGTAAEWFSWLLVAAGVLLATSGAAHDQFVTAVHGLLRRRPGQGLLLTIGLWCAAGLPLSPGFWWRLNLLAAMSVPHRRSSLTNLFEVAPVFFVLAAGLALAWALAASGWIMVMGRMVWEEPYHRRRWDRVPTLLLAAWVATLAALVATPFLS